MFVSLSERVRPRSAVACDAASTRALATTANDERRFQTRATLRAVRRGLTNIGGPIDPGGATEAAESLARVLEAAQGDDTDHLTHGFHAYPARMHAGLAGAAIDQFSKDAEHVLDPFCGSGTVLVEAMVAGRRSRGIDLNPIAVRVAGVKTERRTEAERDRFAETVVTIAAASKARVDARAPAMAPLSEEDRSAYEVHVLKELTGLWEEIGKVELAADRRALEVLFSAIVVKFSNRRAETSRATAPKRIGKGVPTSFFARKGEELVRRWTALDEASSALRRDVHRPRIAEGNATDLGSALPPSYRADLVLTSPPYGGTYDYAEHHALRMAWLGLQPTRLRRDELGARRSFASTEGASARWDAEVAKILGSIAGVLADDGRALLWVGDAEVGGRRIEALGQLQRIAPASGLQVIAWASQSRPDFHGGPPRAETLALLVHGPRRDGSR
jgi:hypothetical protein